MGVVTLISMLFVVRFVQFLGVFGLGLWFTNHNESLLLQFFDLLTTEISGLGRGVRTAAILLLFSLEFWFFLFVFRFILPFSGLYPIIFLFPVSSLSLILPTPIIVIIFSFSLFW